VFLLGVGLFWDNIYKRLSSFFKKNNVLVNVAEGICMTVNVKHSSSLRFVNCRHLFLVSLMSMLLFLVSFFSCPLMVGAAVSVGTEAELVAAVANASAGVPVVITFGHDITLTNSLIIPNGKNITLVSSGDVEFNLFGANERSTVIVNAGGILVLEGIVVTHPSGVKGSGVNVTAGGALILVRGSIFNNTDAEGGGVVNYGIFTMLGGVVSNGTSVMGGVVNFGNFTVYGGKISNNTANKFNADMGGGGVFNRGNFTLLGGEISNNNILCGVYNFGNFTMSGGKIFKNIGGGVINTGNFTMSNGEISNNNADNGGGVYIGSSFGAGIFTLTGGLIVNNSAIDHGGGVYNSGSVFKMSDNGVIANNTATYGGGIYSNGNVTMSNGEVSNNTAVYGGGAYNNLGNFTMTNGTLFNNIATQTGGGIYVYGGNFTMSGGKISNSTAQNGGGIGVSSLGGLEYVYVRNEAVFSNNHAVVFYERASIHDTLYNSRIDRSVVWTSPFKQGYNNYDIYYIWDEKTGGASSSPSSSVKPTGSPGSSPNSPTNSPTESAIVFPGENDNIWRVVIVLVIVVGFVVALLVFYLPRREKTKTAEKPALQ